MLSLPAQHRLQAGKRHYQNPQQLLSFGLLGLLPEQEPSVGGIQGDQSHVVMLVLPRLLSSTLPHQEEPPKASNSHPGYAAKTRPVFTMGKPSLVPIKASKCHQLSREDFDDIWRGWYRNSPCLTAKSVRIICPPRHGPEGPEDKEAGQTCTAAHEGSGRSITLSSHCSSKQSCKEQPQPKGLLRARNAKICDRFSFQRPLSCRRLQRSQLTTLHHQTAPVHIPRLEMLLVLALLPSSSFTDFLSR